MTFLQTTVCAIVALSCIADSANANDDDQIFREAVEPILKDRCYECHSHESDEISSGLTLDWKSGWQRGGERGSAIVPGDPDGSLLIQAIRHTDPDLKMPQEKLPDHEIEVLVEWVQRGASDPRIAKPETLVPKTAADWWSLSPLIRPPVPGDGHPIDAFVQSALRESGLSLSPESARGILIRRLTLDLHGLPPTPDEASAFIHDPTPDAYAKLVDRLLASPRYGERWARHWLDTIHFADTHGFEHDALRPHAWRFRDYVIDSLNRDTAWDRFVREQLAADVFFPEQPELTPALGFLGAGNYDHSAASTAIMAFENFDRDDLVTQTMAAFVSTTANCARCHTHKFDPITQDDYYSLQAVFAGIGKGEISYDADPDVIAARRRWQQLKDAAAQRNASVLLQPENEAIAVEWAGQRGPAANWQALDIESFVSINGASLTRNADGSITSGGTRPDQETTAITATTPLKFITAFRLDVLTDPALPMMGPGRRDNGNLHLTEFEVQEFSAAATEPKQLSFRRASADFDQADWTSSHAIDGKPATAWGIHPQVSQSHYAVFELASPLLVPPGTRFVVLLKQLHGSGHIIGRFSLSVTDSDTELTTAVPGDLELALKTAADQRNPEQRLAIASYAIGRLADERLAELPAPLKVFAAASRAVNERGVITYAEPRTIRILRRGDLDKPGDEARPGALSAIAALQGRFEIAESGNESQRRAALADWIAHRDNPLTWRSIVNRVWQYHYGRGLCDTPSDFGRMGGVPSHPELLDWLAVWFRDDVNGSLKALHRLIVTSAAYRQSSVFRPDAAAVDSDNRLLWRMNRSRLDADGIRDAVISVSGQLDLTMGGPGVSHFLSSPGPQLTPVLDYASFDWNTSGASRRSIYRVVWRGIQDPFMESLDFPDMGQLSPTRGFSVSPLQAMVLFNSQFMLHYTEQFARRVESAESSLPGRIRFAIQLAWLREPTENEQRQLETLAGQHGLTAVCRLLLNSNEFLFVD